MDRPRFHLTSWYMGMMQCYPGKLRLGLGDYLFKINWLPTDDYATLMTDELDDLAGHRLRALMSIEENKKRVARWYDKKVKAKEFADRDLVWKLILPIETKS